MEYTKEQIQDLRYNIQDKIEDLVCEYVNNNVPDELFTGDEQHGLSAEYLEWEKKFCHILWSAIADYATREVYDIENSKED